MSDHLVVEYRLQVLEENLEKSHDRLSDKLDTTIEKLGQATTALAVLDGRLEALETMSHELIPLKDSVANLSYKMKYQLAPGALGGGIMTAVIELIRVLMDKLWQ
jgi:hypothetical protein